MEVALVGLCDGELDPKRHHCSYLTNKVGGNPDWMPGITRQSPRCARCAAPLAHVVQVYCPVDSSAYHRSLHLFSCPAAGCSGAADSWRVLRSQCLEEVTAGRPPPARDAALAATDWCDAADDWGVEEEEEGGGDWGGGVKEEEEVREEETATAPEAEAGGDDGVSRQLQDLGLGERVPVLRPLFISVVEESDLGGDDDDGLRHAHQLLREYEKREGAAVGELDDDGGGGGEEKYEKTKARHGDAVFSRFMKKISLCPQQILRYCRGAEPLFISEPPPNLAQVVAPCASCGASRTFELQLMPALVSLLRSDGDGDGGAEAQLEFGTVLVYTCTNSCWRGGSGSPLEEFCFVQTDPDQQFFK